MRLEMGNNRKRKQALSLVASLLSFLTPYPVAQLVLLSSFPLNNPESCYFYGRAQLLFLLCPGLQRAKAELVASLIPGFAS